MLSGVRRALWRTWHAHKDESARKIEKHEAYTASGVAEVVGHRISLQFIRSDVSVHDRAERVIPEIVLVVDAEGEPPINAGHLGRVQLLVDVRRYSYRLVGRSAGMQRCTVERSLSHIRRGRWQWS